MVEVPTTVGASGIKLAGISPTEHEQFLHVVNSIEEYSRSLVKNFESTTHQIHEKLEANGGAAIQALTRLMQSKEALEKMVNENADVLEQIMADVDSVVKQFDGLDQLHNELLLLSDLLTTVEEMVKRSKAPK